MKDVRLLLLVLTLGVIIISGCTTTDTFWSDVKLQDFVREDLSILYSVEFPDVQYPCSIKDNLVADKPENCTYTGVEGCEINLDITGFVNESCAKERYQSEGIENISYPSYARLEGNVYLMEIDGQRLVKVEVDNRFGYIWQKNRFLFSLSGNDDDALTDYLKWMVSKYTYNQDLSLKVIQKLK